MPTYRILSMDGGGIRGLMTAIILQRLTATPGLERLVDSADLLAGTSTGGLLALGLAKGLDLDLLRRTYVEKGPRIFDDSWLDDVMDLGKLRGADYSITNLKRELQNLLGDATLGQLHKRVLITTFDLDNEDPRRRTWKPKLFHNFPGPNSDRAHLARDVALYTSAAPTYFPSVDGYIDGGVYAANPAMCALAQSLDRRYSPTPLLDEVVLLSLGTGTSLNYIKGAVHNWGYVQWIKPLVSIMLDGTAGIADYQCHQILGDRYHRLAPVFPRGMSIPMDGVDRIPYMTEYAQSLDLTATIDWLKATW
ncbi:MAG: patatin-like phospholipase family protein [Candidatus Latescibacteria bacterium]|nr:patatin-like phospholipase family protein [Candidatus Latescibacterota bacterium]